MRRFIYGFSLFSIGLGILFYFFLYPRLVILSGFSAQSVCACTFIADRTLESIEKEDNGFSQLFLVQNSIDHENKRVSSSVFGMQEKTAQYIPGRGCHLIKPNKKQIAPVDNSWNDPKTEKQIDWPYGERIKDTIFESLDYDKLEKACSVLWDEQDAYLKKTRALLIVYKNHIIYEKYAVGINSQTPLLGWSMTKSIMNALYGICEYNGILRITDDVDIPEWKHDKRNQITYKNLLQMNSGLEWVEDYSSVSDATVMLYNTYDMPAFAINKPQHYPVNSHWHYSSGTTNILSGLLRRKLNDDTRYASFADDELFDKLGMNSALIQTDAAGNYVGSSYCFASARDWAKFGLLYLNDGIWNKERILPENWVQLSQEEAPNSEGQYGLHFWLNHNGVDISTAPHNMFAAHGFQGQRVFILPTEDVVIVRLGNAGDDYVDFEVFFKYLMEAFTSY